MPIKKAVGVSTANKAISSSKGKRAPKECLSRSEQSLAPGRGRCFERGFLWPCCADEQRISSLGKLLKAKNDAKGDDNLSTFCDCESDDSGGGSDLELEEPVRTKQKTDDSMALSRDNGAS